MENPLKFDLHPEQEMRQAIHLRDQEYDGRFLFGEDSPEVIRMVNIAEHIEDYSVSS